MAAVATKYWVGAVSREHVLTGVEEGFCQVCHGKKGPLARMKEGDWLIYYSPKMSMGDAEACQKFTAIGKITDSEIYQYKISENFVPFRRNVTYLKDIKEQAIHPLLDRLSFTKMKGSKWGGIFRFGIFEISKDDFDIIYKEIVGDAQPNKKRKLEKEVIT
jgi:hypothetical protein